AAEHETSLERPGRRAFQGSGNLRFRRGLAFRKTIEAVPVRAQGIVLADLEDIAEQEEIAALRDMDAVAPVAQVLDRGLEGDLAAISAGGAKLVGKRQIVQIALVGAERVQQLMPAAI